MENGEPGSGKGGRPRHGKIRCPLVWSKAWALTGIAQVAAQRVSAPMGPLWGTAMVGGGGATVDACTSRLDSTGL